MKILLIHNEYRFTGGEDIAVKNEIELLSPQHNVRVLNFENNFKGLFFQIISFFININFNSISKLKKELDSFNPDIAYIHNTWFKASNAIFDQLEKQDIPIFIKLHNFRYFCTRYFLEKNHFGKSYSCMACGRVRKKYSFFNKYFEDSYFKSFFVILYGKKFYKILVNKNIKILVLTDFHKKFLINLGVGENRISIFQNYLEKANNENIENNNVQIVYAGRISKEKGVEELLNIFIQANLKNTQLVLIGEGPQLKYLTSNYKNSNIIFEGYKSNGEVKKKINESSAVIIRTNLYENQPTVLCEASMMSKPSIFPDNGGIKEFFPNNYSLKYDLSSDENLINILQKIDNSQIDLEKIGKENKNYILTILDKDRLLNEFNRIVNNQ